MWSRAGEGYGFGGARARGGGGARSRGKHSRPGGPNSTSAPGSPANFGQPRPLLRPGLPPGAALRLSSPHPLPLARTPTLALTAPPPLTLHTPPLPPCPLPSFHVAGAARGPSTRREYNEITGPPNACGGPRPTPSLPPPPPLPPPSGNAPLPHGIACVILLPLRNPSPLLAPCPPAPPCPLHPLHWTGTGRANGPRVGTPGPRVGTQGPWAGTLEPLALLRRPRGR